MRTNISNLDHKKFIQYYVSALCKNLSKYLAENKRQDLADQYAKYMKPGAISDIRVIRAISVISAISDIRVIRAISAIRVISAISDIRVIRAISVISAISAISDISDIRVIREEWTRILVEAFIYAGGKKSYLIVKKLDTLTLSNIENGGELKQETWHACGTTHCRGGWYVTIAKAHELEKLLGTENVASMIAYASSGTVPNFFNMNSAEVLEDIRACAAKE